MDNDNKKRKVESTGIPIDDNLKTLVWNEYLESIKYWRERFPEDFKDTPLELTMPSDINEVFKLRNDLYKYFDPIYADSYW